MFNSSLGLNFLQGMKDDLGNDVFQVKELQISHLHGQLNGRSRLDFSHDMIQQGRDN